MGRALRRLVPLAGLTALLYAAGELSNRPAPDFHLPDSKGRTMSLDNFKGKPLLIEFMSTTCPHCQKFAPVLESIHARFRGRLGVVSIASPSDTAATVAAFVETYKVSYPILVDPNYTAAMSYLKPGPPNYTFSIPHLFLVDQGGYIRDDFLRTASNTELFTPEGLRRLVEGYLGRH